MVMITLHKLCLNDNFEVGMQSQGQFDNCLCIEMGAGG